MMKPAVSIVLPVYNVEKYLEQCLDSIAGQTLRDLQVIRVNDGSTDRSAAILEEYANRDSRFQVFHQENSGAGSARNAAYPHLQGKYTFFADPDDWLAKDLCERSIQKAESTCCDMVFFQYTTVSDVFRPVRTILRTCLEIRTSQEKAPLMGWSSPWRKMWRTEFLLNHKIHFTDGLRPNNDVLHHWKGTVLCPLIRVLPDSLYYYRLRNGSYQQTGDEGHLSIVETFEQVKQFLLEQSVYDQYNDVFLAIKWNTFYWKYHLLRPEFRPRLKELILQSISRDEGKALAENPKIDDTCKQFYRNTIFQPL